MCRPDEKQIPSLRTPRDTVKRTVFVERTGAELRRGRLAVPSAEADHSGGADRRQPVRGRFQSAGGRAAADVKGRRRGREENVAGQQKPPGESERAHRRGDIQPTVRPTDARAAQHEHVLSFAQHAQPVPEGQTDAGRRAGQETLRGQSQEAVRVRTPHGQGRPVLRWQPVQATAVFVAGNL